MTTYSLSPGRTESLPFNAVGLSASTTPAPSGVPIAIPRDELFYWTGVWQDGQRESEAALDAGDAREFASGRDAVRWLLSDDDE